MTKKLVSQDRHGFWLSGLHAVRAALENPARNILKFYATQEGLKKLAMVAIPCKSVMQMVTGRELEQKTAIRSIHQGLALKVAPLPQPTLNDWLHQEKNKPYDTLLILDQVTDPHNIGAILRSCAVFGVGAIIVQDHNSPGETAALARASAGAIETVAMIRVTNLSRVLDQLQHYHYWCFGLTGEAEDSLTSLQNHQKMALVLGAEGKGLRRLVRAHCDQLLAIPMANNAIGSLNVSNAASIALHHIFQLKAS